MARTTKRTDARQRAICQAIEQGATYEMAAASAGIHRDTLHAWRSRDPAFSDALKAAEARGVLACLSRIQQAANDGQWQAAAWILERRYPADYGRRDRVQMEHSGSVDVRVLADLRGAILAAVPDAATRQRIVEALAALDAPTETHEGADADGHGE
jgi:transposase-like protein